MRKDTKNNFAILSLKLVTNFEKFATHTQNDVALELWPAKFQAKNCEKVHVIPKVHFKVKILKKSINASFTVTVKNKLSNELDNVMNYNRMDCKRCQADGLQR